MNKSALAIIAISLLAVVFGLAALAMRDGVGTFIVLVIAFVALGFIGVALYNIFANAYVKVATVNYKRDDLQLHYDYEMRKLELQHSPRREISAPQQAQIDSKFTDTRREVAIKLLSATIESKDYGPNGRQLITQKDAGAIGIIADDWSAGVAYLCSNYRLQTIAGKGVFTNAETVTIGRIMADTAVMSLPENKR